MTNNKFKPGDVVYYPDEDYKEAIGIVSGYLNEGVVEILPIGELDPRAVHYVEEEDLELVVDPWIQRTCDCGAEKTGSPGHTNWCSKHA